MKSLDQRVDRLKSVYSKSFDRTRSQILGQTADRDLQLYDKMTPQAFDVVREKYGLEGLTRYIRHMEHKKLLEAGGK